MKLLFKKGFSIFLKKIWFIIMLLISIIILIILIFSYLSISNNFNKKQKIIITTTTMLNDLVKHLIGDTESNSQYKKIDNIKSFSLMNYGIDPHNYKTKLSDRRKIKNADLIITNGLHLESKMIDALKLLSSEKNYKKVLEASSILNSNEIKKDTENLQEDPHIWFSIKLWQKVLANIKKFIQENIELKTEEKKIIEENFKLYNQELDKLKNYFINKIILLKKKCNPFILVTAHDAFNYLASDNNIKFELRSIQGISTQTETSISDINNLAEELSKKKVKAIFVESSLSNESLKSLQEAVRNKGHQIKISKKELFSDSLGIDNGTFEVFHNDKNGTQYKLSTYIGTFLHNIHTIEEELL
jgi:manganese/zinc/iron transport system substrate-binding protein